ncbi:MAG: redoxin domain-containing protein [Thermoplasmataceae archaeon]
MSVNVGEKAPEFKLLDASLKEKKLSDYKGQNVVLAFFPGAFTSVCTQEMCTFRDSMASFNSLKAKVIGISTDTPFAQAEFAKANKLNFELLSDITTDVSKKYGVLYDNFLNIQGFHASKRAVFVIGKDGNVKYKWVTENAGNLPDFEEVRKAVEKLN